MTLKQALWEIVRDENIIITNQNIDWLLDRALKRASGDAQALKESILERKGVMEDNIPPTLTNEEKVSEKVKQIEEMADTIEHTRRLARDVCGAVASSKMIATDLYNAGYRKQSENTVELHCKVGDTVYHTDGIRIYELEIFDISLRKNKPYYETESIDFDNDAIGKSIFLSKEEAEAKMKGGE